MKKKNRLFKQILVVILLLSLSLSGCGKKDDDNNNSYSETTMEQDQTTEEYDYDEFVNDTTVDVSELEEYDISDEEAERIYNVTSSVDAEIEKFEKNYRNKSDITYDNLYNYLYDLKKNLEEKELAGVDHYSLHNDYLSIYYNSDIGESVYTPEIKGFDSSGGSGVMNIATFQPFKSDYNSDLSSLMSYPDEAADMIVSEFPLYKFDNRGTADDRNYDDDEVTISSILNFGQNNVIIWHGHGGYFDDYGCTLLTTIPTSKENIRKYANEIEAGTLIKNNGYFLITPAFFEKYLPENALANSIIYLGACESGYDDSMINVMINKGAMAVIANDKEIATVYNLSMIKSVAEGMIQKNGEQYFTLDEALEYAKGENEDLNLTSANVYITYGAGYQNLSMNWYEDYRNCERDVVLVLDNSGSMEGYPIEETRQAAKGFVDRVFEQDSRVGLVSYESEAYVDNWLTTNDAQLKRSIENLYASGGTNMYAGLEVAATMLEKSKAKNKIIVLMSDGMPNEGVYDLYGNYDTPIINYAEELKNKGYLIYTLGFFSELDSSNKVTAQNLMESIASPGMHYEIDSADNIVYFFDDIASQISGTQYVYIRIACPVEVSVSYNGERLSSDPDNENTRTSFGTLTYEYGNSEIISEGYYDDYGNYVDDSSQYSDERVKILRLKMDQNYDINIRGTDRGAMNYTVSYPDSNGEYTDVRDFPNIRVTSSMRASSNTEREDKSTLEVDEDGDGRKDVTYETKSNGIMEENKNHTILFVCIGIGVAVVLILVIVIIVAVKKSKKRNRQNPQPVQPIIYPYKPEPVQPIMPIVNPNAQGMIMGLFGSFSGQSVPMMTNSMCSIGRDHNCNLRIMHKSISRMHCTIQLMPDGMYQIIDYSSNGTYYNNQRLISGQAYKIPKGSIIALGGADNVIQLM